MGIMILIVSDWARPWLPGVLASNASLSGYGVAQSFCTLRCLCGGSDSRSEKKEMLLARRHAFESAGFRVDSRTP